MRDSDGSTGSGACSTSGRRCGGCAATLPPSEETRRVTIFGRAQGQAPWHAIGIETLLPQSTAHFSAAPDLGALRPIDSRSMAYAEARARHYVDVLNCTSRDGGNITAVEVACLRTKSADEVLAARKGMPSALLTWSPVVDGVELTEEPQETLRKLMAASGSRNDDEMTMATNVTVLLGSNGDEGSEFTELPYDATAEDYGYFISLFGETYVRECSRCILQPNTILRALTASRWTRTLLCVFPCLRRCCLLVSGEGNGTVGPPGRIHTCTFSTTRFAF